MRKKKNKFPIFNLFDLIGNKKKFFYQLKKSENNKTIYSVRIDRSETGLFLLYITGSSGEKIIKYSTIIQSNWQNIRKPWKN